MQMEMIVASKGIQTLIISNGVNDNTNEEANDRLLEEVGLHMNIIRCSTFIGIQEQRLNTNNL